MMLIQWTMLPDTSRIQTSLQAAKVAGDCLSEVRQEQFHHFISQNKRNEH